MDNKKKTINYNIMLKTIFKDLNIENRNNLLDDMKNKES